MNLQVVLLLVIISVVNASKHVVCENYTVSNDKEKETIHQLCDEFCVGQAPSGRGHCMGDHDCFCHGKRRFQNYEIGSVRGSRCIRAFKFPKINIPNPVIKIPKINIPKINIPKIKIPNPLSPLRGLGGRLMEFARRVLEVLKSTLFWLLGVLLIGVVLACCVRRYLPCC